MDNDDNDVFKPAVAKQSNFSSSHSSSSNNSYKSSSKEENCQSFDINQQSQSQVQSQVQANARFPELDTFIAKAKREMDLKLNKISQERLEEYLLQEREADRAREEEFSTMAQSPKSPKNDTLTEDFKNETFERRAREIDENEARMFKEMREKAKEIWKELEEDYQASLKQMHQEQAVRLAQESQLQESLKASGSVFNRDLFEKVVEKCGKGKNSAYAKEKMARFWEVLENSYPTTTTPNCTDLDKDKLLASLLGINAA